ncbi:hypothetical protein FOMG_14940 [Fusarium oxysporum f. sp. melonis 26406]|uniref:Major facilitator superfamily (MFS) profile domain-containing protein n=1 Tax=Fusarium oxysporum f. sp. melonis 26406 TaxID=1089452 RepID=W9Z9K5_FUSOX|nr:hypothetical protein FOMG_14940 [Fusarium oxysporum f. sp. melonis 26406]
MRILISLSNWYKLDPDRDSHGSEDPRGTLLGLMVNMQVVGGAICLPIALYAADKFGRQYRIFRGSIIIILGALLQGCAQKG